MYEAENMGIDIKEIEDFSHYLYYRYVTAENTPDEGIRVLIDRNGFQRGAETINPITGQFQNSTGRLADISEGLHIEESTEEEFMVLCYAAIDRAKRQP